MLAPVAAFADGLELFTVNPSDFSLSLLERTFGAVGNVLHGQGNEIVGSMLGIFNAVWIIIIGLGVLFVVWDSIMHAAHSGEMMRGHGKKTAFTIIRIVIGFCLVVPSKTTGYSLAQDGVMWVVVQGVGLADKVTQKIHDYMQAGGLPFTTEPSSADDIATLIPIAANILKSEVCMFKLQDILNDKKKKEDDALKAAGQDPKPPSDADTIGYGIRMEDTSGFVTFGSKNPNYNQDDPASNQYLSECGRTTWKIEVQLPISSDTERASVKKTLAGYLRAAVTEMVISLQPAARELASANLEDTDENAELLQKMAERGATAMAGSGISYATLIDPIKNAVKISKDGEMKAQLTKLNDSGWVFAPIMVIIPGIIDGESVQLPNFIPLDTPPDLVLQDPTGQLKILDKAELQQIVDHMNHVDSDNYKGLAAGYLKTMYVNAKWPKIDFTALYTDNKSGYLDGLMDSFDPVFDGVKAILHSGEALANAMLWVPRGILEGIYGVADAFVNGFDLTIPVIDIDIHVPGLVDADLTPLEKGIKAIADVQDSISDKINGMVVGMDDMSNSIRAITPMAEKGGMTEEMEKLSSKVGPLGPMFATMVTAMIGNSITTLENHMFNPEHNALVSSIQMGGEIMRSTMESSFLAGKILFISSMVDAGMQALSMATGGITGGALGLGSGLVTKGIEGFSTFHIALAMLLFSGGVMLYILVPLTFVVAFGAICLRWIGMVLINILGAPIFCFNLIRADGEGMFGRGERYLGDLAKTALTPAILTIGAVVFLILFNIGFMIITTIFSSFIPLLAKAYNNPILVPVSLVLLLMVFATMMVYLSQTLATLCTTEFVNSVGDTIGETIQRLHDTSPAQEMRDTVKSGGHHAGSNIKAVTGGK